MYEYTFKHIDPSADSTEIRKSVSHLLKRAVSFQPVQWGKKKKKKRKVAVNDDKLKSTLANTPSVKTVFEFS